MSVSAVIKSIQDIMRKDAGVDGDAQRIGQLGWMLFLKIFDDQEQELELVKDNYESPIPEQFRWSNWAADSEGITGDELQNFINNQMFPALKELVQSTGGHNPRAIVIQSAFEDAYNYMKNGTLVRQVVNKLNEIDFNRSSDRHTFGDIYEKLLKDLQSAGNAGEFYTPRAVTQFMTDMVDPKLGEKVLDPASGTGGFLACAIEHIRTKYVNNVEDRETLQGSFFGVEKKQLPHLLCTTNMLLHGIEVPSNVRHDNSLSRPYKDYGPADRVDVVLTNPPFGGMEEDGIEQNFPATFRTRETADLFLVLIMRLLKDRGRAAVVLPDGFLSGEGIKTRIKERLLEDFNLHTIIRLPKGVFAPYTSINTNLLFFEKGQPTQEVWYYEHPYPKGYKSYSKTKPMRIEEFNPEKAWWVNRAENEFAWRVSAEDVKASEFNLDIKNPNSADSGPGDPSDLFLEFNDASRKATDVRERLKQALMQKLENPNVDRVSLSNYFPIISKSIERTLCLREAIIKFATTGQFSSITSPLNLWAESELGNAITLHYGKNLPAKVRNDEGTIPVFGSNGIVGVHDEVLVNDPCIIVGRKGSSGALNISRKPCWPTDVTYFVVPPENINLDYCYLMLRGLQLEKLGKGIKPGLNRKEAYALQVIVPPIEEQKRIVAKVDELMNLCDQLEEHLTKKEELGNRLAQAVVAAA